jgi:hypothetical protein
LSDAERFKCQLTLAVYTLAEAAPVPSGKSGGAVP